MRPVLLLKDLLMVASRSFMKTGLFKNSSFIAEDVGNRKSFNEIKLPPDNVGNTLDLWQEDGAIHDGLGNSIDEEPSHVNSGFLLQAKTRHNHMTTKNRPVNKSLIFEKNRHELEPAIPEIADGYIMELTLEFKKLLNQRSGLPFSFSMNPHKDKSFDEA
jgi:hypothetical protein